MMPRDTERDEQTPGLAESRAHPRVKVHSLAYIELSEGNAGLILDISETGMAVQTVQTLSSSYLARMQFRLPKTDKPIQTSGRVIWQVRSKKEAGVKFDALSDDMRETIRRWIAAEADRQAESEQTHLRVLAEPVKPATQATAFQKYPSESGDEDMDVPVPIAASDPRPVDSQEAQAKSENATHTQEEIPEPAASPAQRDFPPPTPRRVPERWRPEPIISPANGAAKPGVADRVPERVFGNAAWNRGPLSPSASGAKRERSWWPYVAAIGLLAAVGFAGVATLDPGIINIANIKGFLSGATASLKQNRPNETSGTQANAAPSTARAANSKLPLQPPQSPGVAQTQGQTEMPQNPTTATQANESAAPATTPQDSVQNGANGAGTAPTTSVPVQQATADSGGTSSSAPIATSTTRPTNARPANANPPGNRTQYQGEAKQLQAQSPAPVPAQQSSRPATGQAPIESRNSQPAPERAETRQYAGNSSGSSNPTGRTNSYSNAQPPANGRASNQPQRSAPPVAPPSQTPVRQQQTNSSALQAWRAQTTIPASSKTASNATAATQTRTPARQENRNEDAYANSAPYVASHTAPARTAPATSKNAAPPPQVFLVDMPGYPSAPAPPSMPLAGVPSGSVAANSQFHAIWVPTNLEWARQYLPGNLGVGRLLSSYSPAYPIEAAREGVQGTVKLDVTVATDGTVRSVHVLGGPPILAHAAVSAVRDWRYAETFLAGTPIETEQYVTVVFRLAPTQ